MAFTSDFVNLYEVLEVAPDASVDQIKEAVRAQRRQWRSRQNAPDPDRRTQAESRMRQIDEAEKTLLDPLMREQYDRNLAAAQAGPAEGAPEVASGQASGQEWVQRAQAYLNASNPQAANYAAREACHALPQNAKAWAIRAQSSAMLGRDSDAEFEFSEAFRLDSSNVGTLVDWSSVRQSTKDWQGAFELLQRALSISPGNPEVLLNMADCHLGAGNPQGALAIIEPLRDEYPDNPGLRCHLASVLLEMALDQLSRSRDGSYLVTDAAQITVSTQYLNRAWAAECPDEGLRTQIAEWNQFVVSASKRRFVGVNYVLWWVIGFVASFILIGAGIGLVLVPLLGWAFYVVNFKRQYQINRRILQAEGVMKWGITAVPLPPSQGAVNG